jgi:hypothetical protein
VDIVIPLQRPGTSFREIDRRISLIRSARHGDAAFGEQRLGPALAPLGVTSAPEVTFNAAHEVFLPTARTVTAT